MLCEGRPVGGGLSWFRDMKKPKFHPFLLAANCLFMSLTGLSYGNAQAHSSSPKYDINETAISEKSLVAVIRSSDTSPRLHWQIINRAAKSGLLEKAVVEYQRQMVLHPQSPLYASAFGHAFFTAHWVNYTPQNKSLWQTQQNKLYAPARYAVEGAVRGAGSQNEFCWLALGHFDVTFGTSDLIEAGKIALQKAVQLDPSDPYAHQWLAFAYLVKVKGFDASAALTQAKQAISLNPTLAQAYGLESVAYSQLGGDKKEDVLAASLYRKAKSLVPPPKP